MSDRGAPQDEWEEAKERLVALVGRANSSDWSPTPLRKELQGLAEQLRLAADRVEFGSAWSELEEIASEGEAFEVKGVLQGVRALSDAASQAASRLPAPQARRWLGDAALLYLHMRCRHGKDRPSLYDGSEAVQEFQQLLQEAGAPRAPETVRNLLSAALKGFDPFMPPAGLDDLV